MTSVEQDMNANSKKEKTVGLESSGRYLIINMTGKTSNISNTPSSEEKSSHENLNVKNENVLKSCESIEKQEDVQIGDITRHNIKQLKKINDSVFPLLYKEEYYQKVLRNPKICKFALYKDIPIGGVSCKITGNGLFNNLYIITLGVLPAYRKLGIGKLLLDFVMETASAMKDVQMVCLHVQVGNDSAIRLYEANGFVLSDTVSDVYKNLIPSSAHYYCKLIDKQN